MKLLALTVTCFVFGTSVSAEAENAADIEIEAGHMANIERVFKAMDMQFHVVPVSAFKDVIISAKNIKEHRALQPDTCGCCRDEKLISFADLGLDHVVVPTVFMSVACHTCNAHPTKTVIKEAHNATCKPTHYEDLDVIFINNDDQVIQKTFKNLTSADCGCH